MLAWKVCTLAAAMAWLAATAALADEPPMVIVSSAQLEAAPGEGHDALRQRSTYWLGLFVSRPSPALQAQLKLAKDQGLLVEALQPESPAAKAGVQQYDILLKGNDKPLSGLHDLLQLIDQVKEGKLKLELLRAGKHETVTVTPAKRPAHEQGETWLSDGALVLGGMGDLAPNVKEGRPLEFHFIRPGQILPPGGPATLEMDMTVHATSTLADGSKVDIMRHGPEVAKVVVTRDKEKWEGTSNDLSKIPEKIRPEVEKLLHPAFDHMRVLANTGGPGGNVTYFAGRGAPGFPGPVIFPPDVEKRLNALQKQVDELRQSVDALQGKAPKKSASKPE